MAELLLRQFETSRLLVNHRSHETPECMAPGRSLLEWDSTLLSSEAIHSLERGIGLPTGAVLVHALYGSLRLRATDTTLVSR